VGDVVTGVADSVVNLRNLSLGYDGRAAVSSLSGVFARGSLTAIVGPNGAGKSTLLKGIVGLVRPLEGIIDRAPLRRGAIAYLPQQPDIDRSFPISVIDTVSLGHWWQIGWARAIARRSCEAARRALAAVGLEGLEWRHIGTLSAGQFQRVLFARLSCRMPR
jgi:zinc/manganese transport system ATP-binding protein